MLSINDDKNACFSVPYGCVCGKDCDTIDWRQCTPTVGVQPEPFKRGKCCSISLHEHTFLCTLSFGAYLFCRHHAATSLLSYHHHHLCCCTTGVRLAAKAICLDLPEVVFLSSHFPFFFAFSFFFFPFSFFFLSFSFRTFLPTLQWSTEPLRQLFSCFSNTFRPQEMLKKFP